MSDVSDARRHLSLAAQLARSLALAFVAFLAVTVVALAYFMLVPLAQRSADDLAALMVLSAQTWVELPPDTRADFEDELVARHGLRLEPQPSTPLTEHAHYHPYVRFLEAALRRRTGTPVHMKLLGAEETWFWAEIPVAGRIIRIGFPKSRIGTQPPLAALVVLAAGVVASGLTAWLLARRIAGPLQRLSAAATRVGHGQAPEYLPETGPQELATLARNFNRMAREVRELLASRTTLLAGISHDLRSPLARMRVALEMLPVQTDPKLYAKLQSDLAEMNRLVGNFLELARGLQSDAPQEIELEAVLVQLAEDARLAGTQITLHSCTRHMRASLMALRRILGNLIDNAVRYGEGKPVEIACGESAGGLRISVLDRGPGIPADQLEAVLRPFYRLEGSRSKATGGSGLGLAIAKQLADAHGWRLDLRPRQGGGLDAGLELPRAGAR